MRIQEKKRMRRLWQLESFHEKVLQEPEEDTEDTTGMKGGKK